MVQIAAAIIKKDGKILICQRKQGGSCSLLWEFPGGKLEPGETLAACAVRECLEELHMEIEILGRFGCTTYQYPERAVEITFFLAQIIKGIPQKTVHEQLKWVLPCSLTEYPFCPANQAILKKLASLQ